MIRFCAADFGADSAVIRLEYVHVLFVPIFLFLSRKRAPADGFENFRLVEVSDMLHMERAVIHFLFLLIE